MGRHKLDEDTMKMQIVETMDALFNTHGCVARAARLLGIPRRSLCNRIARYKINPNLFRRKECPKP